MSEPTGDKAHERHAEICEWLGSAFDPEDFDPEPLKADVAAPAKRWSRKTAAKRPRPDEPARLTGCLHRKECS